MQWPLTDGETALDVESLPNETEYRRETMLFIMAAFAIVTALAASGRGRSGLLWFIIGGLTGIFGLVAVLVMGRVDG